MKRQNNSLLWVMVAVQCICAVVFLWDLLSSVLGLRTTPISWEARELLEIAASLGLILGAVLGGRAVFAARRRAQRAEEALRTASGAFAEVVEDRFHEWGLTPAERDVAWFAIKGMSTPEISTLRGTSEGTIKAQSNAIYRKAGVSGRAQLLAAFVDDLLSGAPPNEAKATLPVQDSSSA